MGGSRIGSADQAGACEPWCGHVDAGGAAALPIRRDVDVISAANFKVESEGVTQADFLSVEFPRATTAIIETQRGS